MTQESAGKHHVYFNNLFTSVKLNVLGKKNMPVNAPVYTFGSEI